MKKQFYIDEEQLKKELIAIKNNPKHNKEVFGKMILKMCEKILGMPCFSGYSENYKQEMISNAVMRIILYSKNFDENKISKITKKPIKAFAYITQIIYNSYIEVIVEKNKENQKYSENIVEFSEDYLRETLLEFTKTVTTKQNYPEKEELKILEIDCTNAKNYSEILSIIKSKNFENYNFAKVIIPKNLENSIEFFEKVKSFFPKDFSISVQKQR